MPTRVAGFVLNTTGTAVQSGVSVTPVASDGSTGTAATTNTAGFFVSSGLPDKSWGARLTSASGQIVFTWETQIQDDIHGIRSVLNAHSFFHLSNTPSNMALGDTMYADGVNNLAKLAGSTSATKKFLSQTGAGGVSAAPVWDTVTGADVTGLIGPPGVDGSDGDQGMPGMQGIAGPSGAAGAAGSQGAAGSPGMDGEDGSTWPQGITTGSLGVAGAVTGSGTLNTIPKWTPDGITLGNSAIVDNGTNVISARDILPNSDAPARSLGSDTFRWNVVYTQNIDAGSSALTLAYDSFGGQLVLSASDVSLTLNGSFRPNIGGNANLGTSTFYWGDAFIGTVNATSLRLKTGFPGNYTEFVVPALATNIIYTLPPAQGGSGETLINNGAGVLAWGRMGAGVPGRDGEDGEPGWSGAPGPVGPIGAMGPIGNVGSDGDDGWNGSPGLVGTQGSTGLQGIPGRDGDDGDSFGPGGVGTGYPMPLGTDLILSTGGIIGLLPVASTALTFSTLSNTGALVSRMSIQSGQTLPNTQLNFYVGTVNFNNANLSNLASVKNYSIAGAVGTLGVLDGAWADAYIGNLVGGDDFNGTDFTLKISDGGGAVSTLLTVPVGSAPLTGTWNGHFTFSDARNIAVGTTTGTKIGTATTQKLAFYNSTPIVQRSGAAQAAVATTGSTNITPFGFTTAAQADAIVTLVNELRAAMVALGLIKGSA